MADRITRKDVKRIEKALEEARKAGDMKNICFCKATLNIYNKALATRNGYLN